MYTQSAEETEWWMYYIYVCWGFLFVRTLCGCILLETEGGWADQSAQPPVAIQPTLQLRSHTKASHREAGNPLLHLPTIKPTYKIYVFVFFFISIGYFKQSNWAATTPPPPPQQQQPHLWPEIRKKFNCKVNLDSCELHTSSFWCVTVSRSEWKNKLNVKNEAFDQTWQFAFKTRFTRERWRGGTTGLK